MWLVLFCFSIQTVAGSGYYDIETPLPYIRNLKTWSFLVAWVLEVKSIIWGSLAICAQAHH